MLRSDTLNQIRKFSLFSNKVYSTQKLISSNFSFPCSVKKYLWTTFVRQTYLQFTDIALLKDDRGQIWPFLEIKLWISKKLKNDFWHNKENQRC